MRYRGVAYYPEAWPVDRWDHDIELMVTAGINLVREVTQELPLPEAEVAILFDYDSALCGLLEERQAMEHIVAANTALNRLGVLADIVPVREGLDLSRYKLVIATELEMVAPWLVAALTTYVESGGLLLAQTRLSTLDRHGNYRPEPLPEAAYFLSESSARGSHAAAGRAGQGVARYRDPQPGAL